MISFNLEISKFHPTLVWSGSWFGVFTTDKTKPKSQGLGPVKEHVWAAEVEEQSSRLAWTTYGHLVSKNREQQTNQPRNLPDAWCHPHTLYLSALWAEGTWIASKASPGESNVQQELGITFRFYTSMWVCSRGSWMCAYKCAWGRIPKWEGGGNSHFVSD